MAPTFKRVSGVSLESMLLLLCKDIWCSMPADLARGLRVRVGVLSKFEAWPTTVLEMWPFLNG